MKPPRAAALVFLAVMLSCASPASSCERGGAGYMAMGGGMCQDGSSVTEPAVSAKAGTSGGGMMHMMSGAAKQLPTTQPPGTQPPGVQSPGTRPAAGGGQQQPPSAADAAAWEQFRSQLKDPSGHQFADEKEVIKKFIDDAQTPPPGSGLKPIKPSDVNVPKLDNYLGDEELVLDAFSKAFPGRDGGAKTKAVFSAMLAANLDNPVGLHQQMDDWLQKNHGTSLDEMMQNAKYADVAGAMHKMSADMKELMTGDDLKWSNTLMVADDLSKTFMSPKDRDEHDANEKNGAPDSPAPFIDSSKDELAQGDSKTAIQDLNRAISLDPNNAQALTLRAEGEYMQHDLSAAGKDAEAALRIDPGNDKASRLMGMSTGHGGVASGGLPNIAGGGGGFEAAQIGAGGAGSNAAMSGPGGARSAAATKNAVKELGLDDYKSAIAHLTTAIEANPNNAQAYNLRSIAYNRTRQYESALDDAVAGLKIAPNNAALLLSKAMALNKLKRFKEAEEAARAALQIDPKNALAYNALAQALAGQRRNGEAIEALRNAAALDSRFNAALQTALQLPADSDMAFLFPDDGAAGGGPKETAAAGQARGFKSVAAASVVGGLLLALGLLSVVVPKIKEAMTKPEAAAAAAAPARLLTERQPRDGLLRGQYQLGRQIGQGGMGMVFEGQDLSLKRRVAVKKMRDEIRLDRRERERFVAEAKVVAGLHHAGIVDVFAILEENDDVFLVFEFVSGKTLHELVYGSGPFTLEKAVAVLKEAGLALDYAHSRNVIHRDLKPSNIMVTEDGRVKVMDFGIARVAKDAMSRYSMTNTVVGTPPYMAPEQEQGVVRRESDVYALGICLYEMLTGKMPFNGSGSGMLLNKINKTFVPASKLVPGLPSGIDEVIGRAFDPDPEKRYHSAAELVGALEALALPQRG